MFNMENIIANFIQASEAESEVERLLKAFLPGTEFAGKVKAVGGYVRDQYLRQIKNDPSIEAKDLDILVNLDGGAEKLSKFIYHTFSDLDNNPLSHPRQLGKSRPATPLLKGYPIWQLVFKENISYKNETYKTKGAIIEFADTMTESYPDSNSRQRETVFAPLEKDIERRDFTTNMLLKDLTTGEIEDLTGTSKHDIEKGILKGHPNVDMEKIFSEDPLRILRLFRFQCKYDWSIPKGVLRSVKNIAERINTISAERITGELTKIMELGKLKRAIKLMSATGVLKYVLPEVEALKGIKQNEKYHLEGDVYRHTLMVLENTPPGLHAQLAALLHDIGKPEATVLIEGEIKAHGHEDVGANMAKAILQRLKFSNEVVDKVTSMVKNHMRPHSLGRASTPKSLRKFITAVGEDIVQDVLTLARADELGKLPPTDNIPDLKKKIQEVTRKGPVKKPSILDGNEVMEFLKIKQGPEVRKALEFLVELEGDYSDQDKTLTKEQAIKELKKEYSKTASVFNIVSNFLKS